MKCCSTRLGVASGWERPELYSESTLIWRFARALPLSCGSVSALEKIFEVGRQAQEEAYADECYAGTDDDHRQIGELRCGAEQ